MSWLPLLPLLWIRILASSEPPCEDGTFREAPGQKCLPCDLCDGDHREYQRRCSGTANALCRCRPGFECGGGACQPCACPAGQEWRGAACRSCPDGTFNNGTGGGCRPWSRCPQGLLGTPGTKQRDAVCQPGLPGLPLALALAGALLFCLALFVGSCLLLRARGKFWKGPPRQLAQEVDECTYRYPEEEEGEGGGNETKGGLLVLEKGP